MNNFRVSVPLPKLTPEGYRVLFYRPFPAKDSHLLTGDDYMKLNYMIAAIMRREDLVKKYFFIYDFPTIDMNLITTMFNAGRKYLNVSEVRLKYVVTYEIRRICKFKKLRRNGLQRFLEFLAGLTRYS